MLDMSLVSFNIIFVDRSLWDKESELSTQIDKWKAEVDKAEKNLDHATPGVSNSFQLNSNRMCKFYIRNPCTYFFKYSLDQYDGTYFFKLLFWGWFGAVLLYEVCIILVGHYIGSAFNHVIPCHKKGKPMPHELTRFLNLIDQKRI